MRNSYLEFKVGQSEMCGEQENFKSYSCGGAEHGTLCY